MRPRQAGSSGVAKALLALQMLLQMPPRIPTATRRSLPSACSPVLVSFPSCSPSSDTARGTSTSCRGASSPAGPGGGPSHPPRPDTGPSVAAWPSPWPRTGNERATNGQRTARPGPGSSPQPRPPRPFASAQPPFLQPGVNPAAQDVSALIYTGINSKKNAPPTRRGAGTELRYASSRLKAPAAAPLQLQPG